MMEARVPNGWSERAGSLYSDWAQTGSERHKGNFRRMVIWASNVMAGRCQGLVMFIAGEKVQNTSPYLVSNEYGTESMKNTSHQTPCFATFS